MFDVPATIPQRLDASAARPERPRRADLRGGSRRFGSPAERVALSAQKFNASLRFDSAGLVFHAAVSVPFVTLHVAIRRPARGRSAFVFFHAPHSGHFRYQSGHIHVVAFSGLADRIRTAAQPPIAVDPATSSATAAGQLGSQQQQSGRLISRIGSSIVP